VTLSQQFVALMGQTWEHLVSRVVTFYFFASKIL
jgi:hypothetical protein